MATSNRDRVARVLDLLKEGLGPFVLREYKMVYKGSGYVREIDDALRTSGLVEQREEELLHLTHAATRECVQSEGIKLVSFAALS